MRQEGQEREREEGEKGKRKKRRQYEFDKDGNKRNNVMGPDNKSEISAVP